MTFLHPNIAVGKNFKGCDVLHLASTPNATTYKSPHRVALSLSLSHTHTLKYQLLLQFSMEVEIKQTILISPASPPFDHDHILSLSHLDNDRNVQVNFRYVRAYANTTTETASPSDPVHVISEALGKALVHYYPFAGTLRRRLHDHRLELFCAAGQAAPLISAGVNRTLDSVNYLDNPADPFLEQLVPNPNPDDSLLHPFVLQVTVFQCGGFTLGASIHHSMCDGLGSTQFFNVMAEFARGGTQPSVQAVWNRSSLLGPRDPPRVEMPFHEFLCLDKEFSPYSRPSEDVVRACFDVKDGLLERFKAALKEESGMSFTTFEALGAFIWRARVKACKLPEDEKVKFAYSINIRRILKPALPFGYWGNGCVTMYAQASAKELVEQPLWKTAELINKSKRNATDEYVRSFIDFQELHYAEGITAGKEVSGFTDWRHLGHSTVDFGWGGPVTVLPLSRHLLGSSEICFFLPYSSVSQGKKDGFKVLVSLPRNALPAFKVDMENFLSKY